MRLTFSASKLPLIAISLALSTAACGDKGDDAAPGPTEPTVETLFAFDMTTEGFTFQDYDPGEATDDMYDNLASTMDAAHARTPAEAASNAVISWDGETGSDGDPGRAKLAMNFSNWNQLADIQVNFTGDDIKEWLGKIVKAKVFYEGGFSSNPSCPAGSYIFVKTGASYVWAKGGDANLALGEWTTLTFNIDYPTQANTPYDPAQILSVGIQFYSGGGSCAELPTAATVYVDTFTVEDAED